MPALSATSAPRRVRLRHDSEVSRRARMSPHGGRRTEVSVTGDGTTPTGHPTARVCSAGAGRARDCFLALHCGYEEAEMSRRLDAWRVRAGSRFADDLMTKAARYSARTRVAISAQSY